MTIDGVEFEKMSSAISGAMALEEKKRAAELMWAERDGMRAALALAPEMVLAD